MRWQGYHVFSIPRREIRPLTKQVRFFGVGGKRQATELLVDCALREGNEEIGAVIAQICSAEQTYLFSADGTIQPIELSQTLSSRLDPKQANIRPRLVLEKRSHSNYGSMAEQNAVYYLVGFNARLSARPLPSSEIAALLYLQDQHLARFRQFPQPSLGLLLQQGAQLDCQPNCQFDPELLLSPHGTAQFLIAQLGDGEMGEIGELGRWGVEEVN